MGRDLWKFASQGAFQHWALTVGEVAHTHRDLPRRLQDLHGLENKERVFQGFCAELRGCKEVDSPSQRSPCCAQCPGNPHRSPRAPGPPPAAQPCERPSRESPGKGEQGWQRWICPRSNSRGWAGIRECSGGERQAEPPCTAGQLPQHRRDPGMAQGRTHLGDEDSQLRGFSSPDVEAELWEEAAGQCSYRDPSLGPVLFPFPRTLLPVQSRSHSPSPPCCLQDGSMAWLQCSAPLPGNT